MEATEIYQLSFHELGFSQDFCRRAKCMGVGSLDDVMTTGPERLINHENFTYHWLAELAVYLNKNKLGHILQPIPGSING